MTYVLGIDQGHSGTRAALSNGEGRILAVGRAKGACHSVHGMDVAMGAIRQAAQFALDQAEVRADDLSIIFCGLTGADWPDEYDLLRTHLLGLALCENVHVKNDSIIALRGGSAANYGAIVIAGTGGNCAVRSPRGEEFIYHFYHDRDLQGGIALGERALRAIYRVETGREQATSLTERVLGMFEMANVDELLRADIEGRIGMDEAKEIAPLVFQASCQGDRVASGIIRTFSEGLAELVTAGLARFDMTGLDVEVVLSGSIFKGPGRLVEEVLAANIHMVAPRARLVSSRYEPVVGAVLLGLEELDIRVDRHVEDNIETSSRELDLIRTRT
jgi:N-acetylglucosamine kinase-like BadF-type ATPase